MLFDLEITNINKIRKTKLGEALIGKLKVIDDWEIGGYRQNFKGSLHPVNCVTASIAGSFFFCVFHIMESV